VTQPLWAPWRMAFIDGPRPAGCFLCDAAQAEPSQDPDHLVVAREERAFAILNRYPYNPGHLMVAPYLHTGDLATLPAEVSASVTSLSQRALRVLQAVLAPEGYNLGFNLGRVAGAGVIDHLHQHVVPRWNGDTNYMPVLAEVKVIPEHIQASYAKVRAGFDRLR
jgi:ATP adenylyltransferase